MHECVFGVVGTSSEEGCGAEGEAVRAPASLAGCLQGSEWNVSIRKQSSGGMFM